MTAVARSKRFVACTHFFLFGGQIPFKLDKAVSDNPEIIQTKIHCGATFVAP